MKAGKLKHRINILVNRPTKNASNENVPNWVVYLSRWASIQPLTQGKEIWWVYQVSPDITHRITLRYTDHFPITPEMRIEYQNRIFDIESAVCTNEERREWVIMAKEQRSLQTDQNQLQITGGE